MARKWEKAGTPDGDGLVMVTAKQKVGEKDGVNQYQEITYGVYGATKEGLTPESPRLWFTALSKVHARAEAGDEKARAFMLDEYERTVYGLDLETRQAQKPDGVTEPRAPLGKEEIVDLVTGDIFAKKTGDKIPGRTASLEQRLAYINGTMMAAKAAGKDAPKAFSIAADALVAAGQVKANGGMLTAVPAKK